MTSMLLRNGRIINNGEDFVGDVLITDGTIEQNQ